MSDKYCNALILFFIFSFTSLMIEKEMALNKLSTDGLDGFLYNLYSYEECSSLSK